MNKQGKHASPKMRLLAAAMMLALVPVAQAEDSQAIPQEEVQALPEPAMAAAAQTRFELKAVDFEGTTGALAGQLQALADGHIGKEVGFGELEALVKQVNALYQRNGYMLARAYLPVQKIEDGRVKVAVSEGVLGNVSIDIAENAPISREQVEKVLSSLEPGKPVDGREYERAMLLLSDLPGIRPQSAMTVNPSGTGADIMVQVEGRNRMQYSLQLDNSGNTASGRHRLNAGLRWASPSGRGDNLDMRLMLAEGMNTVFGRISYEAPLGYNGLRGGVGIGRVQYQLGGSLAPLEPTGVANVVDVTLNYPLVRQRNTNLFLRAAADYKDLEDRFDAVAYKTRKRIRGGGLGLALEKRDGFMGGGYTSANLFFYHGRLSFHDQFSRQYDAPPFGYDTEGSFSKLTLQAARLQYLAPKLSLYLAGGIQRADGNLDSYEKLSLGGPKAVRAYPVGEVLVDDGWLATAELRYGINQEWTLSAFHDAAGGDFFHRPRSFDTVHGRNLRGYGLGLNRQAPGKISMNISLAWRGSTGAAVSDKDKNPRLYWTVQKVF